MLTLADSLVSSSARPLAIRMRPDLVVTKQRYQGRAFWIIKDPVGLNYFRFQEEEYALLNWLDGETSLDELRQRFEQQFPPQKITLEELGRLIGMLHQSGLVIAGVAGQGKQLLKRRWERKKKEWMAAVSNVLAIRFKGIDPERLLNWLYPKVSWFFTKTAATFCICMLLSALTLVLVQFDTFKAKLPAISPVLRRRELDVAGAHDGHHQGAARVRPRPVVQTFRRRMPRNGRDDARAHALLVLQRFRFLDAAQQMASGVYRRGRHVRGMLHRLDRHLCVVVQRAGPVEQSRLSTMFVCSVSTIVFNANPLLRYDGYYILSDLLEIPNLRQKATTILAASWATGAWAWKSPTIRFCRSAIRCCSCSTPWPPPCTAGSSCFRFCFFSTRYSSPIGSK